MSSGAVTHRRQVPVGTGSPDTLVVAAGRALAEVARRLDRDLALPPPAPDRAAATGVVIHTRNVADGAAGPSVNTRIEPPGQLCVELSCPPGDAWEHAAAAVAEMQAELLGALLADPGLDLGEAVGTSEVTRSAVLGPLAGVGVDHGPYRSVPERVRAAARSTPDAVAVHASDGTLTYEQLVGHADALGARIRAAAPEGGGPVPVLVADGLALPVSWAAAMIAGVGYVPIDPRWPAQRIEHVLDLLDGPVVLCTEPATVPVAHRGRAIPVDLTGSAGPATFDGVPVPPGPDQVVYGVYTSGTTGTPLCALNTHGGLANRLAFMTGWFGAPADRDVVLQSTRHTFDSAFWQIFWPLTTGGATVVPTAGEHLDLQDTVDLIAAHGVTVADFVPAVLSALLGLLEQRPATLDRLSSLRHIVVGGEQINPHDVHRLRELLPGLRVSNAYGPSEAAIGMIFHEVAAVDGDDVPLGRPIDNCAAVVVDVDGRPLPPGATGEILIGGACVGVGYHGAPRRTAERFVSCRWSDPADGRVLSGRMYRTGDLGRVDVQGRFHFAGRIDHQIKIRGVRVEPGELESVSLGCAGVRQAVALVVGSAASRELVLVTTGTASAEEALAHLRARLPRGSMPQRAVVVGEMPLTDAGKIDRRELAVRVERPAAPPPVTGADPVLAVLRTALRRPDLAAADDFFAAGGDSLQAVAAVVELSDLFRVDVGVRDVADHPTAAGLSELIARRGRDRGGVPASHDLIAADLATLTVPGARTAPGPRRDRRPGVVRTVLLTGATGFVGARLLHELLGSTDLRVICLVRGRDDAQARRRLEAALAAQRLDHAGLAARTTVVAGDLARPGFGLTTAGWRSLAEGSDLVLHSGAMVNLLYDYRMQREANVLGTAEVIRLARAAGGIPLHHISTLGVLYDHALVRRRAVPEDVDVADVAPPTSGYSVSKWVAERLVSAAALAGDLPVTVLRLGEVMPATDSGMANPSALTHLLLTAFRRLGSVPRAGIRSDYSPVDAVARVVVAAVRDRTVWGRALHVYRPGSVHFGELADLPDVVRSARVSCSRFLADLRAASAGGDHELGMLLAIIEHRAGGRAEDEASAREVLENLLQDNPARFERSVSAALERRTGLDDGSWNTAPGSSPGRSHRVPVAAGAEREGGARA